MLELVTVAIEGKWHLEDPGGLDEPFVEVDGGESEVDEPLPEMDVDAELTWLREEFTDENPGYVYFYKRVIGGHWTMEKLGMASGVFF